MARSAKKFLLLLLLVAMPSAPSGETVPPASQASGELGPARHAYLREHPQEATFEETQFKLGREALRLVKLNDQIRGELGALSQRLGSLSGGLLPLPLIRGDEVRPDQRTRKWNLVVSKLEAEVRSP